MCTLRVFSDTFNFVVQQGLLKVTQERANNLSDSEESNESSNGDIGADIEKLDHKVDLLAQANAQLEEERDGLIWEKACDSK